MPTYKYLCQRCTNCCRWPGFVRLTDEDIIRAATYLNQSEFHFIQTCTRLRPHRDGLALQDQADGSCIFLDRKSCAIHPAKPAQCAGFPNEWQFPGWRESCEAIAVAAANKGLDAKQPEPLAQEPRASSDHPKMLPTAL